MSEGIPFMETSRKRFKMLVKFYSRKQHADKMLAGKLLARRLKKFRETEDSARRDEHEGTMLWEKGKLSLRIRSGESEWVETCRPTTSLVQ